MKDIFIGLFGYSWDLNPKLQSLLDEDGREIRAELIDEVSSCVNELYTMLYNIELDGE